MNRIRYPTDPPPLCVLARGLRRTGKGRTAVEVRNPLGHFGFGRSSWRDLWRADPVLLVAIAVGTVYRPPRGARLDLWDCTTRLVHKCSLLLYVCSLIEVLTV